MMKYILYYPRPCVVAKTMVIVLEVSNLITSTRLVKKLDETRPKLFCLSEDNKYLLAQNITSLIAISKDLGEDRWGKNLVSEIDAKTIIRKINSSITLSLKVNFQDSVFHGISGNLDSAHELEFDYVNGLIIQLESILDKRGSNLEIATSDLTLYPSLTLIKDSLPLMGHSVPNFIGEYLDLIDKARSQYNSNSVNDFE